MKVIVNFDFVSMAFHNFAPLKEKHFWPHVVRRNEPQRSVTMCRSTRVLVSDSLSNRHARYVGASPLAHLYTFFNVSDIIKSFQTSKMHIKSLENSDYTIYFRKLRYLLVYYAMSLFESNIASFRE